MKNVLGVLAILGSALAANAKMVEVKIFNPNEKQNLSPAAIVVHKPGFALFKVGDPASSAVWKIAEDGDVTDAKALRMNADVRSVTISPPTPAGKYSRTLVSVPSGYEISLVSMLASTNDGFIGLASAVPPRSGHRVNFEVAAYDSGTEQNNESCQYVPGPPCAAHDVRMTEGAEGTVMMHPGISGAKDIPAEFAIASPAAVVRLKTKD